MYVPPCPEDFMCSVSKPDRYSNKQTLNEWHAQRAVEWAILYLSTWKKLNGTNKG